MLGVVAGGSTILPRVAASPIRSNGPAQAVQPPPSTWDYTADVVVLGTGFAGLSAAMTAYNTGASVIVLEKMDKTRQGGNSIVAGNEVWAPLDVVQGALYINACNMGRVDDPDLPMLISQGLQENLQVLTNLGITYGLSAIGPANPGLIGASTVKFYVMTYNNLQFSGGAGIWYPLRQALAKLEGSNLKFMYSTPATSLIQDPLTNEILGVTAASSDGTLNVKANRGVVLACGGFEYNKDMLAQYLPTSELLQWGTPGNTGDGIKMAQAVGADLWHMQQQNWGTPDAMKTPYGPATTISVKGNNYIFVDRTGSRYVNESSGFGSYGYPGWEIAMYFDRPTESFIRNPTWAIFDETSRKAGAMLSPSTAPPGGFPSGLKYGGWFGNFSGYTWSSDNSAEIASGWIFSASSIANLASLLTADPDNTNSATGQLLMNPTTLQATVTRWNSLVSGGADTDFGRPTATMGAIQTPPFYAAKLWIGFNNTEGGPKRNKNCQVLDTTGTPIPRLYSAGELGSFYGMLYNGGGNIGECLFTGRIAGNNAAHETPSTS